MNAEPKEKHEEAETRHEGETAIHEHGDPGPGVPGLGEAVLAATRRQPLPAGALEQLTREAMGGSATSLYALSNSRLFPGYKFPDDLLLRMRKLAGDGELFAQYLLGSSDVAAARARGDDGLARVGLGMLRPASAAGMGEATWCIAVHEALCGRPAAALDMAEKAVAQGCPSAREALRFSKAMQGILRMHAQAAKESARPVDPEPKAADADQPGDEREAKIRSLEHQVLSLKTEKEAATARAVDAEAMVGAQQERVAKDKEVLRYAGALQETNWMLLKETERADKAIRSKQAADAEDRKLRRQIEVLEALVNNRGGRR